MHAGPIYRTICNWDQNEIKARASSGNLCDQERGDYYKGALLEEYMLV